jgi:hypothetical protein
LTFEGLDATTTPTFAPKTVLAIFSSASKPGHQHEVRLGADGVVYCTCPSWRFQKRTPSLRSCKHTKAFVARATHGGVTLRAQGAVELPKPVRPARKATKPAESFWTKLG